MSDDWLYDIALRVAFGEEIATLIARSQDLAPLAEARGLSLDALMSLDGDAAGLALEHALASHLDALDRRCGGRLAVLDARRLAKAPLDLIERTLVAEERALRLALAATETGVLARAFARLEGDRRPRPADRPAPEGGLRFVLGPLRLPEAPLEAGDALGFETSVKAALMADDGSLWARLRLERDGFRVEAKGNTPAPAAAWIELTGSPPSPAGLLVGDKFDFELASELPARLMRPAGGPLPGRLVAIEGRLGFQVAERAA